MRNPKSQDQDQDSGSGSDASSEAPASKASPVEGLVAAISGDSAVPKAAAPVPSPSISASASATSMATSPALPQSKTRQSAPPLKVVSEIVKNDPVEKDRSEKRVVESIPEQVTKPETKQEAKRRAFCQREEPPRPRASAK